MHLIVGLGNPGLKYRKSRHNAGFMFIDALANELGGGGYKKLCKALVLNTEYNGKKVILAKPQTYMNLSGEAVAQLMRYFKLNTESLIVIYDDIELAPGALRIRESGSAGTHNGMRSIIEALGGQSDFKRVRIGVGKQYEGADLKKYVLKRPPKEEAGKIKLAMADATEAVKLMLKGDISAAQARYNIKERK